MSNPHPIGDRVLVRQVLPVDKSPSGLLHLPESAVEWPPIAEVLEVGDKVLDVKAGDRVLFRRRPNTDVDLALESAYALPNGQSARRLMLRCSPTDPEKNDILMILEDGFDSKIEQIRSWM